MYQQRFPQSPSWYSRQQGPPPQYQGQHQGPPQYQGQHQGPPQYQGQHQGPPQYLGQHQGQPQYQGQQQRPLWNQQRLPSQAGQTQGPPPNQAWNPPPTNQPLSQSQPGQSQNSRPQQQPQTSGVKPCCCRLSAGVMSIASIELLWAICTIFPSMLSIIFCQEAKNTKGDEGLREFWDKGGGTMLIITILLHGFELIASILLGAAAWKRVRILCFVWILAIVLISLGIIGVLIYLPHPYTWIALAILPFRLYFIWVVWALAAEILAYPNSSPDNGIVGWSVGGPHAGYNIPTSSGVGGFYGYTNAWGEYPHHHTALL